MFVDKDNLDWIKKLKKVENSEFWGKILGFSYFEELIRHEVQLELLINDFKLLLKKNIEIWGKKSNHENISSFSNTFLKKIEELNNDEFGQNICEKLSSFSDEEFKLAFNMGGDIFPYEEIFSKFFDLIKENIVSKKDMESWLDDFRETGEIKDQNIGEKLLEYLGQDNKVIS